MQNLTNNEIAILKACLNDTTREGCKEDNYSNFVVEDMMKERNMSKQAIGGVMTSLISKGLAEFDDEFETLYPTDKGIDTIFDYTEDNK